MPASTPAFRVGLKNVSICQGFLLSALAIGAPSALAAPSATPACVGVLPIAPAGLGCPGSYSAPSLGGSAVWTGGDIEFDDLESESGNVVSAFLINPSTLTNIVGEATGYYLFTEPNPASVTLTPAQMASFGYTPGMEIILAIYSNLTFLTPPAAGDPFDFGPASASPDFVSPTNNGLYFSGSSSRNFDSAIHAAVYSGIASTGAYPALYYFEDLPASVADFDYNDLGIGILQGAAPAVDVPAPLPLFGLGVAYSFSRNLRRRINSSAP